MKPIKVLWIVDHLGYDGVMHGAGKYYLNTIPYFDKNKFDVTLYVLRKKDNLTKLFEEANIIVNHLGRERFDPRTLFDLIKIIKIDKFKIIHTHGYGADNFGRMVGKLLGIPTIIHAHDDNSNYFWHQKIADLFLIPFTYKVIAVSETVKLSCILKRRVNENKLAVFHNGIQLDHFVKNDQNKIQQMKIQYGIKADVKVIGTVGRLRKEKGITYLIQSTPKILSLFPNTIFFIAGDGPLREELKNLSEELKVQENIIFAGFCYDIPAVLSMIDIYVTPSLTEGSPLGILEAMAMEKPIVASNVGGVKEILINNETGLLIPSENPDEIAEKVIYLLQNESKQKLLSNNAFVEIQKYDIKNYLNKLENFYLELLSK